MKNAKKIVVIIAILLIVGFIGYKFIFNKPSENESDAVEVRFNQYEDGATSDLVETTSGVVYTGKVVPVESRYYSKDPTKEYKDTYVVEGDTISKNTVLFDYVPDYSIDAQISVLQKNFNNLEEELHDYYSRIEEYKTWLEGVDPEDTVYKNYLENEIINTEILISENKVKWIEAEDSIRKLNDSKDDYKVKSDIDGLVYKITEDNESSPTDIASAYITIYSLEKKVRVSVSEYELDLFTVGEKVSVEIEGLNEIFEAEIISIDTIPNNLNSDETSYYNVDIEIPNDIPYGYTAKITVNRK